ncbi:MAG: DUF454 domain-containing protein [bacterium]|nr:DUF454 domain-containing protein [bacterium]
MSTNTDAASLHAVIDAEPAQIMSNPVGRAVYVVLGFVCLGLGIAGYIVPLLPGTVFLLLATYFFFKSSERMYNWVLNNRQFGHVIRAYRAGYGIPRRIKAYAIALIVVSMGVSIAVATDTVAIRLLLVAIGVAVSTFILTRPTTETVLASSQD